jgi:hypothetical protein
MIEEYNAIKLKEEKKRSERYKYRDAPSGWILVAPAIFASNYVCLYSFNNGAC